VRREDDLDGFCRSEWPRLVGSLSLYTGDRFLAEELAQETIVRVCRDWHHVRGLAAPGAWAHRVAMNLAHSHFRRRRAAHRANDRARQLSAVVPDTDLAWTLALRSAVAQLPRRQQSALVLRYFVDLPVRTVAEMLRCPEGTVKALTSRAITALRAQGLLDDLDMEVHTNE
jgi:RNA polymerase sigma-70 factor (ECF subfamily)